MTTNDRIVLSQVAPWNPALRNPYRTRWTTAGGRFFKVEADGLYTLWSVSEVDEAGELIPVRDGFRVVAVAGLHTYALNLADARAKIAEYVRNGPEALPEADAR